MVYKVRRKYTPTKGIDLKTGDKIRPMDMLSGGQNCIYDQQGNIVKRPGFHQRIVNSSLVWGGIYPFKTTDYKGVTKSELIGLGRKPYRLARHTLTVTHAGATIGMYVSAAQFHFVIVDAGVTVLDQALGDGTATGVFTVLQLANAINAIAGFTAVASAGADTSVDAFHLNVQEPTVCPAGGVVFDWYVWEAIPEPKYSEYLKFPNSALNEATDVFTIAGHGLTDGTAVIFPLNFDPALETTNESDDPTSIFYVVNSTTDTFQLAAALGGPAINMTFVSTTGTSILCVAGGPVIERGEHLPSAVELNGCLYVATGTPESATEASSRFIGKYDGQTWQRAGVPNFFAQDFIVKANLGDSQAAAVLTDSRGTRASGASPGERAYKCVPVIVDKTGQRLEGMFDFNSASDSAYLPQQALAGDLIRIQGQNRLEQYRGLMDHCAIADPGEAASTLTIRAPGHNMAVGDVAYFYCSLRSRFISREVLTVAAGEFTISETPIESWDSGGLVRLNALAVITANVRMAIYRTAGGITGEYYWVTDIPLYRRARAYHAGDPATFCLTLWDDYADTTIQKNPVYVEPEYHKDMPPHGGILSKYMGLLLVAGTPDSPNTVHFSERGSQESLPLATHSFNLYSPVTAFAASESFLAVGQEHGLDNVVGDLEAFNFRVTRISDNFQAISHAGAVEAEEGIAVFQTPRGPFQAANGRNLAPVGPAVGSPADSAIEPAFYCNYPHTSAGAYIAYPDTEKTIACVHPDRKWLIVHIPWGTDAPAGAAVTYGVTGHRTFVYDFARHCWLPEWTGLDMRGGMAFWEGSFWYLSRNPATGTTTLWQMQETHGIYNLADGVSSIDAQALTSWEALQQAEVYKKYLWMDVFAVGSPNSATWTTRVRSLPNYDYATTHTDASVPFTSSTQAKEFKLKDGKAASMAWMFSNATIYEDFMVSGFAVDIATPIKPPSSPYGVDG